MLDLKQIPFLRFVIPFILGILFVIYIPVQANKTYLISAIALLVPLCLIIYYSKNSHKYNLLLGISVSAVFFVSGWLLCSSRMDFYHYSHFKGKAVYYGKVISAPEKANTTIKVKLSVENRFSKDTAYPLNEKVIAYLRDTSKALKLRIGDKILIYSQMNEVAPPQNPGVFNYKQYLSYHYIKHTCFVNSGGWKLTEKGNRYNVLRLSAEARRYLNSLLKTCKMSPRELGVTEALITGYTSDLSGKVRQSYAATGVIHVLSVSGLHVGIIFVMLDFFLKFMDKKRLSRIMKCVIIIVALWCFAFITGLSTPVLRAATMFSFVVLGKAIDRKSNVYNTIALSAFILLFINPLSIMDVGFQLSYLALLGIITFYPFFYHLWFAKHAYSDKIWALVCVSIAAQLTTFPLCIFYFHQFPNYFIISNLLVIPLATVVLYAGIAFFFCHAVPFLGVGLAYGVKYSALWLNNLVFGIQEIPFSVSWGLNFSAFQVIILFIILILFLCYVYYSNKKFLFSCLVLFAAFWGIESINIYKRSSSSGIYFYQIKGHTAINLLASNQNVLFADSALLSDSTTLSYSIQPNFNLHNSFRSQNFKISRLKDLNYGKEVFAKNGIVSIDGKIILIANKIFGIYHGNKSQNKLPIDMLILTNDYPLKNIDSLLQIFHPKLVLTDGSNHNYYIKKISKILETRGLNFYNTQKNGCYFFKL